MLAMQNSKKKNEWENRIYAFVLEAEQTVVLLLFFPFMNAIYMHTCVLP